MRTPVSRFELVAAILVLLGLIALGSLYLFPALGRWSKSYVLTLSAGDGKGLTEGNKVMIRGIQVGEVINVELEGKDRVTIHCRIQTGYEKRIREGTRAKLVPAAVFGSSEVHLSPGDGEPLAQGATITAEPAISIVEKADDVLTDTKSLLAVGHTLVGQSQARIRQLEKVLSNVEGVLANITSAKGSLGKLVYDEELYGGFGTVLTRFGESLTRWERVLARIDGFTDVLPEIREDVTEITKRLRTITEQVEKATVHLPDTVTESNRTLKESRKVVEGLKRSFFIRPYVPEDVISDPMAPASQRDSVTIK